MPSEPTMRVIGSQDISTRSLGSDARCWGAVDVIGHGLPGCGRAGVGVAREPAGSSTDVALVERITGDAGLPGAGGPGGQGAPTGAPLRFLVKGFRRDLTQSSDCGTVETD